MKTQLTFLGTGTSQGIPVIGCECEVCKSRDPKDNRFRSSALVKYGDITILVDCGPDFRIQMLREDVKHLETRCCSRIAIRTTPEEWTTCVRSIFWSTSP